MLKDLTKAEVIDNLKLDMGAEGSRGRGWLTLVLAYNNIDDENPLLLRFASCNS